MLMPYSLNCGFLYFQISVFPPDGAAAEKNRLEEKQRAARKERKKKKEEWNPRSDITHSCLFLSLERLLQFKAFMCDNPKTFFQVDYCLKKLHYVHLWPSTRNNCYIFNLTTNTSLTTLRFWLLPHCHQRRLDK